MAATAPKPPEARVQRPRRIRDTALAACCLGVALIGPPGTVSARESDAQQPIEVEADSTAFDNQLQRHTLEGDVQIRQGTMSVNAERIVLQLADGKLTEINAEGGPLSFSIEDDTGATVTAQSKQLLYKPDDARLSLLGSAVLFSDGRELSGDRIDYDIAKANVQALSGNDTRVRVVIDPTVAPTLSTGSGD
ncbi:MAG: lipopolysaccharide transport periplasmic protein LptA [Pseudomonadota bacterium]